MTSGKALNGEPHAGNPHVRFDEGDVAPAATPRRGSLFYTKKFMALACVIGASVASGAMLDLQPQIDAVAAKGGGVVRVETGAHEVKPFELRSNVTLELADGARILASTNIADYATRGECPVFIYADHATNVAIVGKGTIDGRGAGFRETAKLRGEDQPKTLPLLMRFSRCRSVRLEGFHYTNPGSWACHLRNCDGVKVKGTSCFNYCNKMNDGLDIESCNVTVEDCEFYADDDSFCFKAESDKSFPVTNVVVRNCRMGSICNAIKFGTGSYNAFRDITIENCELRRSPGAWRFDWRNNMPGVTNRHCGIAGLALEVVDGGRMENVTIRNITMEGYMTPIFIRHHHRHEPKDGKVDTYLRNILIENVIGTADGRIASSITGVPAKGGAGVRRPRNITLRNVSLTVPGGGTEAEAKASVPEKDGAYPEAFMFNRMALPAYGFYVRHADNVVFENVTVTPRTPDARPAFVMEDCESEEMTRALRGRLLSKEAAFVAHDVVLREICAADKAADDAWLALKSHADYEEHRMRMRKRFIEAVGGFDLQRTPLNAKVTGVVVRDGYRVEKVLFESRPGQFVTALVFLPDADKFKPPYRGILQPCGHSDNGKGIDAYQRGGVMGALAGFAVLSYDPFAQGEREVNGVNCNQHDRYGALASLLGRSAAQLRIWDGMRAIDYLLSRDDVMKDGVGCMGNSGGGTMSALLEVVDSRIVASCPSCYVSSLRDVYGKNGPQDAEQWAFGQLVFGLNHAGLVLAGDNAVKMHCCESDFFPIAGSRATYDVVQKAAKNCGLAPSRYGIAVAQGGHGWKESLRTSSVQWMKRWLAGDESIHEIEEGALRKLDEGFDIKKVDCGLSGKEANVTPTGRVQDVSGFKSVFDYLRDDLAAVNGRARCPQHAAEAVVRRAGIRPLASLGVTVREVAPAQRLSDGTAILREVFSFEDGQQVPSVTFMPKEAPKGCVLVVDDRADRGIHRMRVTQTMAEGKAITVVDLAGVGETGGWRHGMFWRRSEDEGLAVMLLTLGRSLVGLRAEQIIALADVRKRRTGLNTEIVAHGNAAVAAAHAFAARRDLFANISCCHTPPSWAESVRNGSTVSFANVVHGALRDYDWPDLLK